MTQPAAELVLTRVFHAPRALVFQAFTDPQHLARWWGPKGFAVEVVRFEGRPGGVFHYVLRAGAAEMWGRWIFEELTAPERLVFRSAFSDKDGGAARHAMAPGFPLEVHNVVTFTEQDGETTITMRGGPLNASAEERAFYASILENMNQGFAGTFAQLDAHLASLQGETRAETA